MFSGIVAVVGYISQVEPRADGAGTVRLTIDAGELELADVVVGDSIACRGVCLTVVEKDAPFFSVDVSPETLHCTVGLTMLAPINLEKALRLVDRLGGHLVTGHVDGVGEVLGLETIGDNRLLTVRAPVALARYIARKGSITVDGVSLTTNAVQDTDFSVNLIPHTLQATTLGQLQPGNRVNLEIDLIARYCERMLSYQNTV